MAWDSEARRVLLFGGTTSSQWHNDTWSWNGTDWQLLAPSTTPAPSSFVLMAAHAGTNPGPLLITRSNGQSRTWRWTGTNWFLAAVGGLPGDFSTIAAVSFYGRTYVQAGPGGTSLWSWDGTAWSMVTQTNPPPALYGHTMTWHGGMVRLLVTTGWNGTAFADQTWRGAFLTPDAIVWTATSNFQPGFGISVPSARDGASAAFDSNGNRVLVFGGGDGFATMTDLLAQDSSSGLWRDLMPTSNHPPGRQYADMAYDRNSGRCMLVGGWSGSGALADTWTRDAVGWTHHAAAGMPPLILPAIAWHPSAGMVLFGGASAFGGPYTPGTMTWHSPSGMWLGFLGFSPPPRYGHDMVTETPRNRIVMFGGYDSSYRNDTWEFLGTSWQQITTIGAPSPRSAFGMAFDERRQRTVLFGGQGASGHLGDTWEYDGWTSTWSLVNPPNAPTPRWNQRMTYDAARGVVVLFGGYSATGYHNDVWEYDGVNWIPRQPDTISPTPRESAAIAFDGSNGRILAHGGYDGGNYLSDTWNLDAKVEVQGAGMGQTVFLKATTYPRAGSHLGLEFVNPSTFGWVLVHDRPDPVGVPLSHSILCTNATIFGAAGSMATAFGNPGTLSLYLPLNLAGCGITCQGVMLDVSGPLCFNVTHPLSIVVQPF